jgi:hypothetical protein
MLSVNKASPGPNLKEVFQNRGNQNFSIFDGLGKEKIGS